MLEDIFGNIRYIHYICIMKIIYIYSLSDPNGNIRYIGKTTNIKRRLYSHIAESKQNNNRYGIWFLNTFEETKQFKQ